MMVLSLPGGNHSASADARLRLDPLQLGPVVEDRSGEQRFVLTSTECPAQAEVDVMVEVLRGYCGQMLVGGRPQLKTMWWPRLLDCLSGGPCGQPGLAPAASWDHALRSLLTKCHSSCRGECATSLPRGLQ